MGYVGTNKSHKQAFQKEINKNGSENKVYDLDGCLIGCFHGAAALSFLIFLCIVMWVVVFGGLPPIEIGYIVCFVFFIPLLIFIFVIFLIFAAMLCGDGEKKEQRDWFLIWWS